MSALHLCRDLQLLSSGILSIQPARVHNKDSLHTMHGKVSNMGAPDTSLFRTAKIMSSQTGTYYMIGTYGILHTSHSL